MTDEQAKTQSVTPESKENPSIPVPVQYRDVEKFTLTRTKLSILCLKWSGLSHRAIAKKLKVSTSTVQDNLDAIPEDLMSLATQHLKELFGSNAVKVGERLVKDCESKDPDVRIKAMTLFFKVMPTGFIAPANVKVDNSQHNTTITISTQEEFNKRSIEARAISSKANINWEEVFGARRV